MIYPLSINVVPIVGNVVDSITALSKSESIPTGNIYVLFDGVVPVANGYVLGTEDGDYITTEDGDYIEITN